MKRLADIRILHILAKFLRHLQINGVLDRAALSWNFCIRGELPSDVLLHMFCGCLFSLPHLARLSSWGIECIES